MARLINRLSARQVELAHVPRHYGNGAGLQLIVGSYGRKQWVFRYRFRGARRNMGLGAAGKGSVSLAQARALAADARKQIADKAQDASAASPEPQSDANFSVEWAAARGWHRLKTSRRGDLRAEQGYQIASLCREADMPPCRSLTALVFRVASASPGSKDVAIALRRLKLRAAQNTADEMFARANPASSCSWVRIFALARKGH